MKGAATEAAKLSLFEGTHIAVIIVIAALAAFVQGYAGFGFGIVCMAVLSFLIGDLERVAALIMILAMAIMLAFLLGSRSRHPIRWKHVALIVPGMFIGTPLGLKFIEAFGNMPVAELCLGIMLAAFAAQGLVLPRLTYKLPAGLGPPTGAGGGFLSGAFSTGGPPLVLYLYSQTHDPRQMKSTVKACLLALTILRAGVMAIVGRGGYTPSLMWAVLWCLPVVLVMLFVGHWVSTKASIETFRKVVYGLIGVSGVLLIGRFVWG